MSLYCEWRLIIKYYIVDSHSYILACHIITFIMKHLHQLKSVFSKKDHEPLHISNCYDNVHAVVLHLYTGNIYLHASRNSKKITSEF